MRTPERYARVVDNRDPAKGLVDATIESDLSPTRLESVESMWALARAAVAGRTPLEHAHWDWRHKVDSVLNRRHRVEAIFHEGECQGLMAILRRPIFGKLAGPLVYLDYLEVAPWNLRWFVPSPRFLGVGTALVREVIRLSHGLGMGGRVGLHSLPQAEEFYERRCGMTRFGADPDYYDLSYFEYTEPQARVFIDRGGETLP